MQTDYLVVEGPPENSQPRFRLWRNLLSGFAMSGSRYPLPPSSNFRLFPQPRDHPLRKKKKIKHSLRTIHFPKLPLSSGSGALPRPGELSAATTPQRGSLCFRGQSKQFGLQAGEGVEWKKLELGPEGARLDEPHLCLVSLHPPFSLESSLGTERCHRVSWPEGSGIPFRGLGKASKIFACFPTY